MPDTASRPRARRSVFASLLLIMLTMTGILAILVAGFFPIYVGSVLNASIDRVAREYARAMAASAPGYEQAKEASRRAGVQVRYEGTGGGWTTAATLPTIAAAEREGPRLFSGRRYFIASAPNGGRYLFAWRYDEDVGRVHVVLLTGFLLLIAGIVFAAHAVLRHLLGPLRELAGGVARVAGGDLEVSVPKRSNDEFGALADGFNEMVGQVREMIRARDQLLLDVSHELRSPITRLKVALELAGDARMKARMAGDLAEMEIMIGELIELERLRDGRTVRAARQDVVPLLQEVARGFEDRPPGVRVASATPEIEVEIDADRMRTVIRNLVENAVSYSRPDSRHVEICASAAGDRVVIRVTDDGPGIPDADIPSLFEPFFRVDRSRSKKTGGYGLGLSIAKRIVEAHGGTIAVENTAGGGASFIVTLPSPTAGQSSARSWQR